MKLFDKIAGVFGFAKERATAIAGGKGSGTLWQAITKAIAFRFNKLWLYACAKTIAEDVASMEFRLYARGRNREQQEIVDHPLLDLLEQPNDIQDGYEFWLFIALQYNILGEAFIHIVKNDSGSKVLALLPISGEKVQVDTTDELDIKYRYTTNTGFHTFSMDEIIHLKDIDPANPHRGKSKAEALSDELNMDNAASEYSRATLTNIAAPAGLLTSDKDVKPAEAVEIARKWQDTFQGVKKANKIAFMNKNIRYQDVSKSLKDMELGKTREFVKNAVLTVFRVPLSILTQDNSNRATAEANNTEFARRVVKPQMKAIVSKLNHKLVPAFMSFNKLKLGFVDPVPVDKTHQLAKHKQLVDIAMTRNEVRQEIGLPPYESPAADQLLGSLNQIPIDALANIGTQPPPADKTLPAQGDQYDMPPFQTSTRE